MRLCRRRTAGHYVNRNDDGRVAHDGRELRPLRGRLAVGQEQLVLLRVLVLQQLRSGRLGEIGAKHEPLRPAASAVRRREHGAAAAVVRRRRRPPPVPRLLVTGRVTVGPSQAAGEPVDAAVAHHAVVGARVRGERVGALQGAFGRVGVTGAPVAAAAEPGAAVAVPPV